MLHGGICSKLKNVSSASPATFQRLMDRVLRPHFAYAAAYLDGTDASDSGLGAFLSQEVIGGRPAHAVHGGKRLPHHKVGGQHPALLSPALLSPAFTLWLDHAPLQWLHRIKDANVQITRWYLPLQPLNFRVVHRPGNQMVVADFLSHYVEPRPESRSGEAPVEETEEKFLTMNMLPLLACLLPLTSATVVKDFNDIERCKDSLYMGTPPRGFTETKLKKICQRYEEKPRFVTLYDPQMRIPVYSAYTFKKTEGDRRVDYPWMYEPQLAEIDGNGNMQPFPTGYQHMKFEDSQAVLDDFSEVVLYERGHLNPDQHQSMTHDRAATYTLTNVVPLIREFNTGPWREYEEQIRIRLNNFCRGTAYIVTGVTTRGQMIRRNNQDRIAIPEEVWSAYCCPDFDQNAPHDVRVYFPNYGVFAKNAKEGNSVHEMSVQQLEILLKKHMPVDQNLQLFYDNCESPSPLPLYLQNTN
ncbi:LOW QUALITY PROTEIN: uncharacterized protein LOC115018762 [Cottoperca gobio]|uniref:LOW QUALITY PROTEIN: uncharacterized protein LOC115018762 n=1 Tax=Cottoperca gobio TaxID=56716 RepID=A0A6J2R303_COTGO|nr:LOW QUALITY PROTEIN: uncharacterized protein LOC115018762 [Cottoperca gobio]